jgi:tetratricopeptide (TPR) repeat protein
VKTVGASLRSASIAALLLVGVTAMAEPQSVRSGLAEATNALQSGQADKALSILGSLSAEEAGTAEAHNVRCRVYYTVELFSQAQNECQQAVNLAPQSSMYHLWLGRAIGEAADRASFVYAYGLAKRARAEFEQAVQLDPRNAEALADLGEFYSAAPGVVGGGSDKAAKMAEKLDKVDAARAHELRAAIAQENHDYVTAERELRAAISSSQHAAFQWMSLASFFRRQKRYDEMESAVQNGFAAAQHDRKAGVALFNGASVLMKANRNYPLADKLLQAYLANPNGTEEAPAFIAHAWLAKIRSQQGDKDGARQEQAAALALANEYKPAQELRF